MLSTLNLLRPLLAVLILFLPLYPKFPLLNVSHTYVAIRLDDLVVAFCFIIWFIRQTKSHFPFFKQKITWLFVTYFIAIFASFLHAVFILQTTPINLLFLHLFRRFEYISVFFITIDAIKTKKDLSFPLIFLALATIGVSIYGFGQKYLHWPVVSTMNSEFSKGQLLEMNDWTRISSTFAGHYDLAAYLSMVLVIIGGMIAAFSGSQNFFLFPLWLIAFYTLTLTASRISIFALWGSLSLTFFFLRRPLLIVPLSLFVAVSIFQSKDLSQRLIATVPSIQPQISRLWPSPTASPTPTPTYAPPPPSVVAARPVVNVYRPPRATATPTPTVFRHAPPEEIPVDADAGVARSGEIRFNAEWPRAITAYRKNPLLGTGLGSITLATDNDYLRSLGESGLWGTITFFTIVAFFIFLTLRSPSKINLIFLGALLVHLANAVFIDVFEASKTAYTFWIFLGIYHQTLTWPKKS